MDPTNWQPIETAPKDGTRVLLWWHYPVGQPGVTLMAYGCSTHGFMGRRCECPNEPGCQMEWLGAMGTRYGGQPTHWMPLPDRPA